MLVDENIYHKLCLGEFKTVYKWQRRKSTLKMHKNTIYFFYIFAKKVIKITVIVIAQQLFDLFRLLKQTVHCY